MSNEKLFAKIGEAVVNPSWEITTDKEEQAKIKEVIFEKKAANFITRVQNKMAGCYYKGAVYTGEEKAS